jgi:hypothetical protein
LVEKQKELDQWQKVGEREPKIKQSNRDKMIKEVTRVEKSGE